MAATYRSSGLALRYARPKWCLSSRRYQGSDLAGFVCPRSLPISVGAMPILRIQVAVVARARWEVILPTISVWLTPASLQSRGVLPLEMVDNSIYPCELISGWFSPHSTLQVGNFVL